MTLTIKDIEYEYRGGKPRKVLTWPYFVEMYNRAIRPWNNWVKDYDPKKIVAIKKKGTRIKSK